MVATIKANILFTRMVRWISILTLVGPLLEACHPSSDPQPNPSSGLSTGVAVTPRHFPDHTPAEVADAFKLSRTVADHAVFIFQWGEFDPAVAKQLAVQCASNGLAPVLSLSPTTLAGGRKELDLPADVRRRAGANLSFANPDVREAFVGAAEALARLKPPYLCLATEINFLAQRIEEFVRFASLYKEAYRAVKKISPGTAVFVSFQWEFALILDLKEPNKIDDHTKLFDIFRPELDAVGLTTYPSGHHVSPADMPANFYDLAKRHLREGDVVLFTEVGWPSGGSGSEGEQAAFIDRLPGLMRGLRPRVVAWSLLHDVSHPAFDAELATTGLLTSDGRAKPALDRFRALR